MNTKLRFQKSALWLSLCGSVALAVSPAKNVPAIDPGALDRTVNPCTDFYQYACGTWINQQALPAGYSRWTRSFNSIDAQNLDELKTLLEAYASGGRNAPAIAAGQKIGDYYAACMDTAAAEQVTATQLPLDLGKIDAIQKPELLAPELAALHAIGVDALFAFTSDRDYQNAQQRIAVVDRGGMGLPDKDYYLDQKPASVTLREQYVAHIAKTLTLSGMESGQAANDAAAILKLETALAQASLSRAERRVPANIYHASDPAGLKQLASGFDWDEYFAATEAKLWASPRAPAIGKLNIAEPVFLREVGNLVASTPLPELRAYLRWQYLRNASSRLGKAFVDEDFDFYGRILNGKKAPAQRWQTCVDAVSSALGEAVGEAYVKTQFSEASKQQTEILVENIHHAVAANFAAVEWMDAPTREQALNKLSHIVRQIGYPDHFKDYSSVGISRTSYLHNAQAASAYAVQDNLSKIGKPTDRNEWEMTPQTVNAYYEPTLNEIVFPAAILQLPFYSIDSPLAWNYGAIGMVIGHETTHAFDDEGRHFDANGNLVDWWTPKSAANFEDRASCLANQYDQYTVAGGVHLNGRLTLGENIADLGGIKLSYAAYTKAHAGQPAAPDFAGFNEDQQFFVAFAQSWCTKETPEYQQLAAKTDPHANPRYRVNGVLVNVPAFQQAFSCPTGAPMAPANRCVIW